MAELISLQLEKEYRVQSILVVSIFTVAIGSGAIFALAIGRAAPASRLRTFYSPYRQAYVTPYNPKRI